MQNLPTEEQIMAAWTDSDQVMVSICCCAYNQQDFIDAAISGFLLQQTNFRFEVIVHDDASGDATARIIAGYQARYPRIIKAILQKENQFQKKVSPLLCHIFPLVRGKYIAICDGDDYWTDPQKLQRQLEALEADHNAVLCHHNVYVLNQATGRQTVKHKTAVQPVVSLDDLINANKFATLSVLFRAEFILPLPLPSTMVKYLDRAFWLLLLQHGYAIYIDQIMAVYRQHEGGIYSGVSGTRKLIERIASFQYVCEVSPRGVNRSILQGLHEMAFEVAVRQLILLRNPGEAGRYFKLSADYRKELGIPLLSSLIGLLLTLARKLLAHFSLQFPAVLKLPSRR
jgi:glycosyltransferase involved in cell wall biosynthesis